MKFYRRGNNSRNYKRTVLVGVLILSLGCVVWGQASEEQSGLSIPEMILAKLHLANEKRSAIETEKAEWKTEKARLELLGNMLREEISRYKEKAQKRENDSKLIRKEMEGMVYAVDEHRKLRTVANTISGRINESLDKLSAESFPGVVPLGEGGQESDTERFENSLKRLADVEKNYSEWDIGIVSGLLDGEEVAVRLLRAGNCFGWWMSLNGESVGTARMEGGKLVLDEIKDAGKKEGIFCAFGMEAGKEAPGWALLPVVSKPVRRKAEGK
ncbi:MAG: hypothetical protein JXR97_13545 [Planctomycetes bacterium]|nr:hypothetical protein [Planctomycetota bacterium]